MLIEELFAEMFEAFEGQILDGIECSEHFSSEGTDLEKAIEPDFEDHEEGSSVASLDQIRSVPTNNS